MIQRIKNVLKTKQELIIISAVTSVVAFIFVIILPSYSYNIDYTRTALMISGGDTEETEIEIKITGRYTKRFFRTDRFKGNFMVEGFVLTQRQAFEIDIDVGRNRDVGIIYNRWNSSQLESVPFGVLYADKGFRRFLIIPYQEYLDDPEYTGVRETIETIDGGTIAVGSGAHVEINGETITVIAYPAKTRNDAVKMTNSRLKALNKYLYEDFYME